jgi:Ca2+-transporting ATPase
MPLDMAQDSTGARGLTAREAAERLAAEGPNLLPRPERRTLLRIITEILREPMFALLLGAGGIYLLLGDFKEAVILFLFACTSVGIAVVQEARTERVLESLRDLTSPRALVIRDGVEARITGAEVVRGDLMVLAEGDRVPADARALAAHDLMTDESLLTGESTPVRKRASPEAPSSARPGGDLPFVYSGSLVVRGSGRAEITATGPRSEIGKIGVAITGIEMEPPRLQAETGRLVRRFAAVSLSLSALAVPLYGLMRGGWLDAVLSGIALGMSMLPEEFPLVLTVFMVMGAWRISSARVLTRHVSAIETLGAATVLCTDKTGTLTENRMTIVELHAGKETWQRVNGETPSGGTAEVIRYGILASAREPFDPMEKAFYALGREVFAPGDEPHHGLALKREYGLRADLLAVANVWEEQAGGGLVAAVKGAPEAVAALCRLSSADRSRLSQAVDQMAGEGMRVLGIGRAAPLPCIARPETPRSLTFEFLGLVGLADPLRPTVPEAVRQCRSAAIRVVMITGDYPRTARAIAAQAGLDSSEIVSGAELETMSDPELARRAGRATVFARTIPEQKLRIVQALKSNGKIVAMTGDGVNDAPSLKAAHIGIAMGGRGTDVAREASSLVLLDDDFASIVSAIRLGRRIYDNLRKAMAYILAIHVPIAGLALIPLLFGLPLIFWPLHIAFFGTGHRSDVLDRVRGRGRGERRHAAPAPPPRATALQFRLCRLEPRARRRRARPCHWAVRHRAAPGPSRRGCPRVDLRRTGRDQSRAGARQSLAERLAAGGVPPAQCGAMVGRRRCRGGPDGAGRLPASAGIVPLRAAAPGRCCPSARQRRRDPAGAGMHKAYSLDPGPLSLRSRSGQQRRLKRFPAAPSPKTRAPCPFRWSPVPTRPLCCAARPRLAPLPSTHAHPYMCAEQDAVGSQGKSFQHALDVVIPLGRFLALLSATDRISYKEGSNSAVRILFDKGNCRT